MKRIIGNFFNWLFGRRQADRLLLAATVVAGVRMMLISAVYIGFDLSVWPWFKAVEVWSGLAFAALEGVALAYISALWVSLDPTTFRHKMYWVVLGVGQLILLLTIIIVTAFAVTTVRLQLSIDDFLGIYWAVGWSAMVTSLNPLMVILIGIARAIDPAETEQKPAAADGGSDMRNGSVITWLSAEQQARIFAQNWSGSALTPDEFAVKFSEVAGIALTADEAERVLLEAGTRQRRNGNGHKAG